MEKFDENQITKAIISSYYEKLIRHVENDVLVVGAGPSGLVAAYDLARRGFRVAVIEKRLAPGGGIWGGGMGMNEIVIQEEALEILRIMGMEPSPREKGLYTVPAVELASALCLNAIRAGAEILNLLTLEDISLHAGRVSGVVVNRTMISGALHVDPLTLSARAVIDGTGHDAVVVEKLRKRGLIQLSSPHGGLNEGPMNAAEGETFVVDQTGEVFPGLWICGMSVCAVRGGPRMGPIFGGMLLSGKKVAEKIAGVLKKSVHASKAAVPSS